ncbi:cell division protein FtsZ [Eisenibacter elegans]|jgi:cell division protein FtsZ|uniref:cell division protein FtsZ n=1 Tax=Eisenibacter elegans TaxID=997 RepID=UPI00041AE495|nr:cell division protein FtsZ [Eisenibacter elegans]
MANSYEFDIPVNAKSIIKVIGVGGGGSNAVNYMYNKGIQGVEFIVCNTDLQALNLSPIPKKLQIGVNLTQGLGAGANPEKGREAALESKNEIREMLQENTRMLFITAGMGGGTGTGAAPIIAEIARELGILTVAIVTAPFTFEGRKKKQQAEKGIEALKKHSDTVLVISNDRLSEIYGNLKMSDAFAQADNILATAAKGIAEIITVEGYVNVDFEDVKTVMRNSGSAVMGSAKTEGEDRALRAAQEALNSPLLNNQSIRGAQKILLSVMSSEQAELQLDEFMSITEYIQNEAGEEAEVIFGNGIDPTLGDSIRVTIVATGFESPTTLDAPPSNKPPVVENTYKDNERSVVFNIKPIPNPESLQQEAATQEPADIRPIPMPEEEEDEIPEPPRKAEPTRIVHNLDDEPDGYEDVFDKHIELEREAQKQRELEAKRERLAREAEERIQRLKKLSSDVNQESFKEKLEIPAYLRRPQQPGRTEE